MKPTNDESSLDPVDWDEFSDIAHQALDDMIQQMKTIDQRPPWRPFPADAKQAIEEPVPASPTALGDVMAAFRDHILPYPTGNAHPRFWGWVMGNGTAEGMLADMLASGMNPHLAGYDQTLRPSNGR